MYPLATLLNIAFAEVQHERILEKETGRYICNKKKEYTLILAIELPY